MMMNVAFYKKFFGFYFNFNLLLKIEAIWGIDRSNN